MQGTLVDELEPLEKKVVQLLKLANEKLDCSIERCLIEEYQSRASTDVMLLKIRIQFGVLTFAL